MKRSLWALVLVGSLGAVAAYAGEKTQCKMGGGCCAAPTTAPTTQASAPVNKICPVMHEEIDPKITAVYEGKTIAFCCKMCVPKFEKDPAKYLKDLK